MPSYQRSAEAYERLAKDKLVGTLQAEERRREALEKAQDLAAQRATVESLQAAIAQHETAARPAEERVCERAATSSGSRRSTAINRLEQQLGKLNFQSGLLELRHHRLAS